MPPAERFKPEHLLRFDRQVTVVDSTATGLNKDEVYELRWKIPQAAFLACKNWIYLERRTLTDFTVEFRHFTDTYRTLSVSVEDKGADRGDVFLIHTIAKGLIETLIDGDGNVIWDEARKVNARNLEGNDEFAGDSEDVEAAIPNTTSDDQERHITVMWRYIDPELVHGIIETLNASTYTSVSADGEAVSGTWHRIFSAYEKQDDGTCNIILQLAEPQYTLNAYRDLETVSGADVVYLWQVPKDLAQGIMDAWKVATPTEGRQASASYDSSGGLVNITLTRFAGSPPNLTQKQNTACDEETTYHFAWRYTKAELGTFLANHNGTLGANMRRDINVRTRSDGFFDAIVTERVITFNEDKHIVQVNTVRGNHLVERHFGWNCPMSEIDSRRTAFEVSAEGITSTFTVRRQDDCSFDYEGTIQVRNITTKSVDLGGTGIQVRSLAGDALTQDELDDLATGFESAIRKRVSADIRVDDDGLASARFTETEVQKAETSADTGTEGVVVAVMTGRNVDAADLSDIYETAAREQVSLELSANDDGSFNYTARKATIQKVIEEMTTSAAEGITTSIKSGKNVDPSEIIGIAEGGRRSRVNLSLSGNDDGTLNYTVVEQTLVEFSDDYEISGSGTTGVGVRSYVGQSVDPATLDTVVASLTASNTKSFQISVDPNDDETINYKIVESTTQAAEDSFAIPAGVTDGLGLEVATGTNKSAADVLAAVSSYSSGARKSHEMRMSLNDAGGWNYTVAERTVQKVTGAATSGAAGIAVDSFAGSNVDAAELVGIVESGAAKRVRINISTNDDGTFNYSGTKQTLQSVEDSWSAAGTGQQIEVWFGRNLDSITEVITTDHLSEVSLDPSLNDDGTINYRAIKRTKVETQKWAGHFGAAMPDYGIQTRVLYGRNATPGDLSSLMASYPPAARTQHSLQVSANDSGGIDYTLREVEINDAEAEWNVGLGAIEGLPVTIKTGNNVELTEVDAAIASFAVGIGINHQLSLSGNDDGTFDYVARQVTEQKAKGSIDSTPGANPGMSIFAESAINVNAADLASVLELSARERASVSVSPQTDGGFGYSIVKQTLVESDEEVVTSGGAGFGVNTEVSHGENLLPADLAAKVFETGARIRWDMSLSANPDGTLNYNARKTEVVEVTGDAEIRNPTEGIGWLVAVGGNEEITVQDVTKGMSGEHGVQHTVRIVPNDDGTLNYVVTERRSQKAVSSDTIPASSGTPSYGEEVTVTTGRYQGNADMSAVLTALSGAARSRIVDLKVSANDDGSFNYFVLQRSRQTGLVENRKIGAINRLVTLNIGDFEDDFPATFPATPPTGTTLKLTARSNPDGTLTYRTEEIEAKHMAGPGPLRHGTFTQQQETDVVRNSQWEPSTATPTQGVSHRVEKMTRNDDGTVDYMLTKIEREPVSEPIVLARRNTARESAGYTYNATVFKGVTTLPAGSGDYWYFSSIAIESDGTFTGVLNDIVIGDPNLTTLGIGGAGGTFIKRHYKSVAITGGYELYMRKTTFNYQIIMTRNQPTAITFMSSGDSDVDRSNVRIVSVEGVQWFRAVRVTYGTEGQWGLVAPPTP